MTDLVNIVWLKRDLRLQDHAAFAAAEKSKLPYRIIYIFDPVVLAHHDSSLRHLQFIYHSLQELNQQLSTFNRQVDIFYGSSIKVFQYLLETFCVKTIFSHQETGVKLTWDRDKAVNTLLNENGIPWEEFPSNGVVRGITDRKGWDKRWFTIMHMPIIKNRFSRSQLGTLDHHLGLPVDLTQKLKSYPKGLQPAGEAKAWQYLESFCEARGFTYNLRISKPLESRTACSRLSVYLAWGNLSIHQAFLFVKAHPNFKDHKRAFGAFLTRLKWHCHFIQKFEVECEYETLCINRGYELLDRNNNLAHLEAWKKGETGYPLVDACMRAVTQTGWINFRMRAMLVSFLCHHLDQDWRNGVYHLAQQFLDYEPGIHYPQFQMQAGTTGINTVRIYNPVKQSQDHDPEGKFIKQYVPELAPVTSNHIHEPWKMTEMEQQFCGVIIGRDYPSPIVDLTESGKQARKKIWGHRSNPVVRKEKERILKTHTRRG